MNKLWILGAVAIMAGAVYFADTLTMAFAKEPAGEIKGFHIGESQSAYLSGFSYDVKVEEANTLVKGRWRGKKGLVFKVRNIKTEEFIPGLQSVVREKQLYKWDGFHKSAKGVLDGTMWGMRIKYPEKTISAGGSNSYPKGYGEGKAAAVNYIKTKLEQAQPDVKASYTLSEVKPYILEALKLLQEQKVITATAPGEIFMCEAKGNLDLNRIVIDTAMDPGHAFQVIVRDKKVLAIKATAANGKNIKPYYALLSPTLKFRESSQIAYDRFVQGVEE